MDALHYEITDHESFLLFHVSCNLHIVHYHLWKAGSPCINALGLPINLVHVSSPIHLHLPNSLALKFMLDAEILYYLQVTTFIYISTYTIVGYQVWWSSGVIEFWWLSSNLDLYFPWPLRSKPKEANKALKLPCLLQEYKIMYLIW
jgi:hypothetical protein